ncbi:GDSL-type esterase/lipase family protein [Halalkalibacillus sediminis]|uniref:GDSL-type esterase/lipase family protein n=1 Tax=Halalkalibacillus sediminis TaxID=2018042 RepID=UPI00139006DE|nr:GDSL-type esterase/lipase family protein [Halalkalibacillus sediminis]
MYANSLPERLVSVATPIVYKALGDSLTVGVGAFFSKGFVGRYAEKSVNHLQRPIRTQVIAKRKMTSHDLVKLTRDEHQLKSISQANIITITIGGNDLLEANRLFLSTYHPEFFEQSAFDLYMNVSTILYRIKKAKTNEGSPYLIRIIGLYNPYPQLSYSDYWVERYNQILRSFSSDHIVFIDIYPFFQRTDRNLLSFDGLHPNKHGYEIIANETAEKGYFPLINRFQRY